MSFTSIDAEVTWQTLPKPCGCDGRGGGAVGNQSAIPRGVIDDRLPILIGNMYGGSSVAAIVDGIKPAKLAGFDSVPTFRAARRTSSVGCARQNLRPSDLLRRVA